MDKGLKRERVPVWDALKGILKRRGAGYLVLIDPDAFHREDLVRLVDNALEADVDAFLVGGSYLFSDRLDDTVQLLKTGNDKPVILFPGSALQLNRHADGLLFLSLISGRNPQFLIEEQVRAAPVIKKMGLEPVPTGYMLIGGGNESAVEFITTTRPIPAGQPELAGAHALAAQYLGMKLIYLESGSGALNSVPEKMIVAVKNWSTLPVIVGGGITEPEAAASRVKAGADFIVTGNVLERPENFELVKEFAKAVRCAI